MNLNPVLAANLCADRLSMHVASALVRFFPAIIARADHAVQGCYMML
jgi:hypothetical protein